MQDGQIAEIIEFKHSPVYEGAIVQRYDNALILLGKPSGKCWPRMFEGRINFEGMSIRILAPGTQIEI